MLRQVVADISNTAPLSHAVCCPAARSTEPHTDEYYTLDIQEALREAGLVAVEAVTSDPRHRVVMAHKPRA